MAEFYISRTTRAMGMADPLFYSEDTTFIQVFEDIQFLPL